jgi:predicted amidohydrolase YtcJ
VRRGLLLTGCEIDGRAGLDVRVREGVVVEVGTHLAPRRGDEVIAASGGALLPGLHDHHLHLLAMAAALASVNCGPPAVRDREALAAALRRAARAAPPDVWVRGVGYHESVAGSLDADALDALVPDRPVRVQHRSGQLWILNRAALRAAGIEHDLPIGRLFRGDRWLSERVPPVPLDLDEVGRRLAATGVTGVTDATPDLTDESLALLVAASHSGALPQRLLLLGAPITPETHACRDRVAIGAFKLVLHEDQIDRDATGALIARAHAAGRAVAIHCVTRVEVVIAVDALARVGVIPGDRLEHASVLPAEVVPEVRRLGVAVVTQPNFVAERGDEYVRDVDTDDLDSLYRCGTLLRTGVGVAGSTDAPFGFPDPWRTMRAAVSRRTASGAVLGRAEAVAPETALALFSSELHDPGGPSRQVRVGAPGDLCLLHAPLASALAELEADLVAATIIAGEVVHRA